MRQFNDWGVSYSTIRFVEQALEGHTKVSSFERSQDIVFEIELTSGAQITMLLVNEYTLGMAAIYKAIHEFPGVDYIVTCADWNAYTREAKDYGVQNDIGIFVLGEFFGALNWSNPKKYVKKDANGKPVYNYRSA